MSGYVVKFPVNHDGKHYDVGAEIELTEEWAAPLLACGAIDAAPVTEAEAEASAESTPGKKGRK